MLICTYRVCVLSESIIQATFFTKKYRPNWQVGIRRKLYFIKSLYAFRYLRKRCASASVISDKRRMSILSVRSLIFTATANGLDLTRWINSSYDSSSESLVTQRNASTICIGNPSASNISKVQSVSSTRSWSFHQWFALLASRA